MGAVHRVERAVRCIALAGEEGRDPAAITLCSCKIDVPDLPPENWMEQLAHV
jgi:hypothetical protein